MGTRPEGATPATIKLEPYSARAIPSRGQDAAGRWYWQVRLHEPGGVRGAYSCRATRDEMRRDLIARIAAGDVPKPTAQAVAEAAAPDEARTVRDLLEFWMGSIEARLKAREISAYTAANYRFMARVAAGVIGETPIAALRQTTIDDLSVTLRATYSAVSSHTICATVVGGIVWAMRRGLCPTIQLRAPTRRLFKATAKRVATIEEFWRAADATPMGWAKAMLMIVGLTGCRPIEAARARWSDYNAEDRTLRIGPHDDVRNDGGKHPRVVSLPADLVAHLDAWRQVAKPATAEALITGQRIVHARHAWHRRIPWAAAGVRPMTGYDLRRMVSERYISRGVDPKAYESQMGHGFGLALRVYRQHSETAARQALDLADLGRPADPPGDPKS